MLKKLEVLSIVGVSVVGAVFHNIGQILVAMFMLESTVLLYYLPFLLVSALVCGVLIGILGSMMSKRLAKLLYL